MDQAAVVNELNCCLVSKMEADITAEDWRVIKHSCAVWESESEYLAEAA